MEVSLSVQYLSWKRRQNAREIHNNTFVLAEPRAFLMEKLQQLIKSRAVNLDPPAHFDKSNIEAVFGMMDPTKRGVISLEQYKAGTHFL